MPTYDYRCDDCGHEFEAFQMMSAEPLTDCPECGKPTLTRLIGTGAGVIFKGSGFWQTDYRSEGYKKAAKAEQDAASGKSDKDKKDTSSSEKSSGEKSSSDTSTKTQSTTATKSENKSTGSGDA